MHLIPLITVPYSIKVYFFSNFLNTTGLGFGLTFLTSIVILTYYFDTRLARANGISSCGTAVAIFVLPPFLQVLIGNYGWRGTLLILAGLLANIGICGALYRPTMLEYKGKLQSSAAADKPSRITNGANKQTDAVMNGAPLEKEYSETQSKMGDSDTVAMFPGSACMAVGRTFLGAFDFTLFRNFYFDLLLISYLLQGLAYIIVIQYLPVRAVHAGISELNAAYLISAIGISSGVARLTHGYLIDYHILSASALTALSHFVSGLACALNPITDNYGVLVTLSVLTGLSSGVYNSTNALLAKEYIGLQRIAGGVGFTFFMIGAGVILGSYLTGNQ